MKISPRANINILVERDRHNEIENIRWTASDAPELGEQQAKALITAFWDAGSRQSLRYDLWAKDMTVQDMNDFFFQTLMTLADTYQRATNNEALAAEIKIFAQDFAERASKAEQRSMQGNNT